MKGLNVRCASAIDKTARSIWGKTIRAMKAAWLFLNQRQITTF